MRIRAGFVSNSSSTSFLIITEGDLTNERFMELVGVQPGSPLAGVFVTLFESLRQSIWSSVDFGKDNSTAALERFKLSRDRMSLSDRMLVKIEEARKDGLKVTYGELSSEENLVETFFCVDSFELQGDGIYLNALEAGW